MGHVVHYRSAGGETRLEDVVSMEAAVELIERLRNDENVDDVRLFREVPLRVRTYYKIEVDEPVGDDEQHDAPVAAGGPDAASPQPEAGHGEPPPGAMNLAPPPSTISGPVSGEESDADAPRRSSLFSRG